MTMNLESLKWLLEHAAATYEAENKSTDKIRERISFILSLVISPCFGVAVYLASSVRGQLFMAEDIYLFWIPLFLSIITLLISICYLAYVLIGGFLYSQIPPLSQIISFFESHPDPDSVLQDAYLGLLKEYSDSTDHNFKQNQHRKSKLLLAQRLAFFSFIFLILCIPRWAYNFAHNEQKAQSIKIVSPVQLLKEQQMADTTVKNPSVTQQATNQSSPQKTASSNATAKITPQEKPSFPQSRMALDSANSMPTFPKSTYSLESFDPKAESPKNSAK